MSFYPHMKVDLGNKHTKILLKVNGRLSRDKVNRF